MTQQEINEGNRLIAEFMGAKPCKKHPDKQCFLRIKDNKDPSIQYWHLLKYHSSWDWLMPVIGKIAIESQSNVDYYEEDFYEKLHDSLLDVDIKETYEIIIKFIKWFNENK